MANPQDNQVGQDQKNPGQQDQRQQNQTQPGQDQKNQGQQNQGQQNQGQPGQDQKNQGQQQQGQNQNNQGQPGQGQPKQDQQKQGLDAGIEQNDPANKNPQFKSDKEQAPGSQPLSEVNKQSGESSSRN